MEGEEPSSTFRSSSAGRQNYSVDKDYASAGDSVQVLIDSCREETARRFAEIRENIHASMKAISNGLVDADHSLPKRRAKLLTDDSWSSGERRLYLLRVNKIFRDVAKALPGPDDWRPLFDQLTADQPREDVSTCKEEIEGERPFIRTYKALHKWKELAMDTDGSVFNIEQLVDALITCNMSPLAASIKETLTSEGDILFNLSNLVTSRKDLIQKKFTSGK